MVHPLLRSPARLAAALIASLVVSFALAATTASRGMAPAVYTLVNADGSQHGVPFRTTSATDLVPLEDVASLFALNVREDTLAGGVTVTAKGQRIVLTPGQALASVAGRVVSLSGSVVRDGRAYYVPVDFLSRALGPALNVRIEVRRASHFIVVGDARVPQVTVRVEREPGGARLAIETQPSTNHRVTRDGAHLTIRFDADVLDPGTLAGSLPDFVTALRTDGPSLLVDLGPLAASFRVTDDSDPARFTVELLAPAPSGATPAPARPAAPQEPPPVDLSLGTSGGIRTIVIDPGHGGDDQGVHGAGGTIEKDLTLQIAHRLKANIESRIGLRVLLTRDADENVPVDRRTAFANNNQADLLLSLHANASFRADARGAQVLSLSLEDYKRRAQSTSTPGTPVPVVGGTTRMIEIVPWDLAQIPFASKSSALGSLVVRHLTEQNVPLYLRPLDRAPLRILAGANMPAVLIELGFLSNADDEKALTSDDLITAVVNALVATIVDVRGGAVPALDGGQQRR